MNSESRVNNFIEEDWLPPPLSWSLSLNETAVHLAKIFL